MLLLLALLGAGPLDEGQAAYARGDYATAVVELAQAYDAARDAGDSEAADDALLRLSSTYRQLGRYAEASAALDELASPGSRAHTARGSIARDLGDLARAERELTKAFQQAQRDDDPDAAMVAALLLGVTRMDRGDLEGAEKALSASLTLAKALGDRVAIADVQSSVALLARRRGDLAGAVVLLEEALEAYRLAGYEVGEVGADLNLALVLEELGQSEDAVRLYTAALTAARARKDLPHQARAHEGLGGLAVRDGDLGEARTHYGLAVQAYELAGRPRDAVRAQLNLLAVVPDAQALEAILAKDLDPRAEAMARLQLGRTTGDLDELRAAVKLAEDVPSLRWKAHAAYGQALLEAGRTDEGIEQLVEATALLERTRRSLSDQDAGAFLVDKAQIYEDLVAAYLSRGDTQAAFLYAQRLQMASIPAPVEDSAELARYQALQDQEAWLAERLSSAPRDSEQAEALRAQLAALHVEFSATVDELRATYPDFDQAVRVDPDDLEAVQRDLDPGVLVLQPLILGDKMVLMVVSRDSLRVVEAEVPAADVERTVSRLTRSLRAQMIDDAAWTQELCDQLGGWILGPIAEELAAAEVLVINPTGPFQQLPFALLRHEDQWLVEHVALASVTHVGSLRTRGARDPGYALDGRHLLLIGNPDGSLPQAEDEVRAIAADQPGSTLLVGSLGGRDQLVEFTGGKTTLHLATHGVIDPLRPERSYLVLGDDSQPGGRLSYREIPGLAPYLDAARLVVLSACESGLPVTAPDAEGTETAISINGLSAQFRRAGVETLVASLWKVDDEGTRRLMEGFYANLAAGQDVAQALRNAQLDLAADEELGHPWFWAAFVVMGDWR